MKKLVLIFSLFAFSATPLLNAANLTTVIEFSSVHPGDHSNLKELTAYKVTQVGGTAWSKAPVTAYYDKSANELHVGKLFFSVTKNPAYGQEKDGRSEFKYVAGGYYFNV